MGWLDALLVLYGLLNIVAGIMGYAKSPVSLYAGATAGVLVLLGVYLARSRPTLGYGLAALVCLLLLGRFLPVFLRERDLWPAGTMAIVSAVVLVALVAGHFVGSQRPAQP